MTWCKSSESSLFETRHLSHCRVTSPGWHFWRHTRRGGVSYSHQYAERGLFQRLMNRLRTIAPGEATFLPVLAYSLTIVNRA
jgi:hypothetical protein